MKKPTPRPWTIRESTSQTERPLLCIERAVPSKGGINGLIAILPDRVPSPSQWKANAVHIVRCVNTHDELIDALKHVKNYLVGYGDDGILNSPMFEQVCNTLEKAKK